jgi:tetratricopeptide (TPR) repeat protein
LAHAYLLLDWTYASLGRYDEAVYSSRALAIYEELGNLTRQGLVLNNMGVFAHFQGRWDEALDLYRRAGHAWEEAGDRWNGAGLATMNVGEVLADQGHVEEAEVLLRDALRVVRASESGSRIGGVTMRLGRLLSRSGRFEEAHALLGEARDEYRRSGFGELGVSDAWIAECLMLQGEPDAALALWTEALETARSLEGAFDVMALLQRVRGCALLQLGRLEEAQAALVSAVDEARNKNARYELALALDALAALARATGAESGELEQERDAILERLGAVRIPQIPLLQIATPAG